MLRQNSMEFHGIPKGCERTTERGKYKEKTESMEFHGVPRKMDIGKDEVL